MIQCVRALCLFAHNFWLLDERCKDCERCAGWKEKSPAFALFYFDKQANFCPGSSIFLTLQWRHKYRMNVPLLCSGSHVSPSINKKSLGSVCELVQSVDETVASPSGVCLLSISCIINNIQFGLLSYENTLRELGMEMTRNQPAVWAMSRTPVWGETIQMYGGFFPSEVRKKQPDGLI